MEAGDFHVYGQLNNASFENVVKERKYKIYTSLYRAWGFVRVAVVMRTSFSCIAYLLLYPKRPWSLLDVSNKTKHILSAASRKNMPTRSFTYLNAVKTMRRADIVKGS